jgi:polysaccharide biosynthesis protein PslG
MLYGDNSPSLLSGEGARGWGYSRRTIIPFRVSNRYNDTEVSINMHTRKLILLLPLVAIIIAALTAFIVLRPPDDPFRADAITNPAFPSLTYSIQAFLWWDGGEVGTTLDYITTMGFTHVKQTFAWKDMELSPGEWDFSQSDRILDEIEKRNLKLIARLGETPQWARGAEGTVTDAHDTPPADLSLWANYCGTLATRYRGRIAGYQIWNEPNLSREWGGNAPNATDYIALLRACSDAIRAADPEAKVISAGLAPTGNEDERALRDDLYLDQMYKAGFAGLVDAVGAHAPGFTAPDIDPAEAPAGRWASFRRIEDLRKIMVANGDASRQLAILETGWTIDDVHPEYSWYRVTEAEQGRYLRGGYEYAAEHWRPWVGLMSAIYMSKPVWTPDDEEYWWSITYPGTVPGSIFTRYAFDQLTRMAKVCGDQTMPARDGEEMIPVDPDNPCH